MAKRTKEEIQKEVAERSAAARKAYFQAQEEAKAGAAALAPDLPASDAYKYSYIWRQDPGAPTGEQVLVKNVNPYYDAATNTILDPATGERKPATQSMFSGPSRIRAGGTVTTDPNAKNPVTGLTLAQTEAAAALAAAKGVNTTLAAALGATVDPKTGKIIASTIDPAKAATWYASQNPNANVNVSDTGVYAGSGTDESPFTKDGKPFTGTYNGVKYINGRISRTSTSDSTLVNNAATSTSVTGFGPGSQGYADRKSAYDLLFQQFDAYGLGALVTPLKGLIESGVSPAEFTIKLRETDAYKKRFAANASRIAKGLRALSEAEYIGLEDQYQDVMRRYGLPESYYTRGEMGRQEGFEKFIGGDVSPVELEDRIQTAQNRVINAAPEVTATLKQFYPDITNGDILAYALDPSKAIENIKRKVTAAEIGAGAAIAGLSTGLSRAEELQRYGVTGEAARTGYQTIGSMLPRATQLGDIYAKSGMGPYDQATAEAEVFGTPGAIEAQRKRQKLTQLEQAQFGGSSGATGGALSRERAGQY